MGVNLCILLYRQHTSSDVSTRVASVILTVTTITWTVSSFPLGLQYSSKMWMSNSGRNDDYPSAFRRVKVRPTHFVGKNRWHSCFNAFIWLLSRRWNRIIGFIRNFVSRFFATEEQIGQTFDNFLIISCVGAYAPVRTSSLNYFYYDCLAASLLSSMGSLGGHYTHWAGVASPITSQPTASSHDARSDTCGKRQVRSAVLLQRKLR